MSAPFNPFARTDAMLAELKEVTARLHARLAEVDRLNADPEARAAWIEGYMPETLDPYGDDLSLAPVVRIAPGEMGA